MQYVNDMTDTRVPDYNDEPIAINAADICISMVELTKQSEAFCAQFAAIVNLTEHDKLCIVDNKLFIQKMSPWRHFVRKYKKQNRSTLAVYLKTEIVEYANFICKLCRTCNDHVESVEMHRIAVRHYDFIQHALTVMKSLRDKYNVRANSNDISTALEMWCLKLTKMKSALLDIISNKPF